MNKARIAGVALAIFLFAFATVAQEFQEFHKQLPAAEKKHILDGPFAVLTKTQDMPGPVKQAFAKIIGESSFSLANPGQKFQATDVIIGQTLPHRRLIFAGTLGSEWFVHYERGGIGVNYCVLLFSVDSKNGLQFIWGGYGLHPAKNLEELRKMVADGQFSDDKHFYP